VHPQDALGVESVDRLVEQDDPGFAEQCRGDAEPLAHAERERSDPAAGHRDQSDEPEDLVDERLRDGIGLGQAEQVVVGRSPRMHRLGLQHCPHFVKWPPEVVIGPASVTCPASGRSSPRIMRMVVDLPEPFGPRNPVTTPDRTRNERLSTARVLP
jgi:hypothetical protein